MGEPILLVRDDDFKVARGLAQHRDFAEPRMDSRNSTSARETIRAPFEWHVLSTLWGASRPSGSPLNIGQRAPDLRINRTTMRSLTASEESTRSLQVVSVEILYLSSRFGYFIGRPTHDRLAALRQVNRIPRKGNKGEAGRPGLPPFISLPHPVCQSGYSSRFYFGDCLCAAFWITALDRICQQPL